MIGGAHGGAPEVIEDGVTGYLVPHGDAAQLATSIETLLSDPALAQKMGGRAGNAWSGNSGSAFLPSR